MTKPIPKRARKVATKKKRTPKKSRTATISVTGAREANKSNTPRKVGRPPLPDSVKQARAEVRERKRLEVRSANAAMEAARLRYVFGFLDPDNPDAPVRFESLKEVSVACGVPLRTLTEHSSKGGWVDKRLEEQAKVAERSDLLVRRRLSVVQASYREEVHTVARLATRKLADAVRMEKLDVLDLSRTMGALDRGLSVTERAIDPSKGVLSLGGVGAGARWVLLCSGLDPVEDAEVLDVIPEEAED